MLKRKLGKKLAAGVTALAMVASASAASISTLTAYAGQMTGEGTFNEGAGLPWHICENGTGSMAFTIDNGIYSILIKNPGGAANQGEDRWDCQFRHRGLSITYGNTYRLTYSVYATNAGKLYAKIGDITNDDAEYWHSNGDHLTMSYTEGASMDEVETALKSASTSGQKTEYWTWGMVDVPAKTWTTFAYEFKIDKSLMNNITNHPEGKGTVEWTFHFGGDGKFTPDGPMFPAGTILKFDNLCLIDMTDPNNVAVPEEEVAEMGIQANQVGYYPNLAKEATLSVEEGDSAAKEFTVYDSTGTAVYTGTTSGYKKDDASWTFSQLIDFSDLTTEGTGYYIECDGKKSLPFDISTTVYDSLVTDAINYFYLNRSGVEIEASYVSNKGRNSEETALARAAGHLPDEAYVSDEWVFIYDKDPKDMYSTKVDVTGGWYDAGDYGKYVVNGGVSMWTLANMYERSVYNGTEAQWADGSGLVKIPETGDSIPDILNEIMWEADFFLKMQREDGLVYHKIHDYKWTALGVMPYAPDTTGAEDPYKITNVQFPTRITKPVTYAATLNLAAALAQLSRLVKPYDSAKATEYLAAAEKAYKAAKDAYVAKYSDIYADVEGDPTTDTMFAPLDQNKGGGPYGDTHLADEFYWAACELYITTENADYYTDVKGYGEAFQVPTLLFGGENKGSFTSFTWGTLASLGTASLAMNQSVLTEAEAKQVVEAFQVAADTYLEQQDNSQYGTPYRGVDYETTVTYITGDTHEDKTFTLEGGYEWGSNSMVVNNALIMGLAYDLTDNVEYLNGVSEAMDYIFGRNANENSFVTGYGDDGYMTENPHHRYWCHQMKEDWPYAPAGCLSGGMNSNMNDPMIQGAGYKIGELAPMLCYYDQVDAWSVNEITINWNSPLAWCASFMADEGALDEVPDTSDDTTEEPGDLLLGDVNCDGEVTILDVIKLNKNLLAGETLEAQGILNADVDQDQKPTTTDSLNILKYVIKLISDWSEVQ